MEKDLMTYKKNHYILWDKIVDTLKRDGINYSKYYKFCDLKYSRFESIFGRKKLDETVYGCFLCDYYPKCSVCPLCKKHDCGFECKLYNDLVHAYDTLNLPKCIECAEKIRDIWGGEIYTHFK